MSYDPKELIVDQLWIIPKNFLYLILLNDANHWLLRRKEPVGWDAIFYLIKFRSKDKYLL